MNNTQININLPARCPQHSIGKSVFYHLIPAICIVIFYLLIGPVVQEVGFHPSIGVLLGFILVGIPIQVYLISRSTGRQKSFNWKSFREVIYFTNQIPWWQYLVIIFFFLFYSVLVVYFFTPIRSGLVESVFGWLPEWFLADQSVVQLDASTTVVIISFAVLFIIDGVINPVVEEIYFRGFLMPRLSRFGAWSALINAGLFSLAHLWQPWNILQIFVLVTPLYMLVWYKKSIYISILIHCLANLVGATSALLFYLNG